MKTQTAELQIQTTLAINRLQHLDGALNEIQHLRRQIYILTDQRAQLTRALVAIKEETNESRDFRAAVMCADIANKALKALVALNPTRQDSTTVKTFNEKEEHEKDLEHESRQDYESDQLAGNPAEYGDGSPE